MGEPVPEIRFRPSAEAYAKASRMAEALGLSVVDVARIGFTQVVNQRQLSLEPLEPANDAAGMPLRDLPVFGGTVGRLQDIARAAGKAAFDEHVKAGRLDAKTGRSRR